MRNFLAATRLLYTQALSVELVYRFSLFQAFFGVAVGLVGLALFWLAAGRGAGTGAIYTPGLLLCYFVVTSAHAILQENKLSWNVSTGIRMGKLSASMLRPYPYLMTQIAQAAATATIRLALLAPVLVVLYFALDGIREVADSLTLERVAIYTATLAVSFFAGWMTRIAIGLLAFDMTQTWGPELIFISLYSLASGISYPVDLLPPALLAAASWTPVYYMIGFPALVLLGKLDHAQVAQGLGRGAIVAGVTGLAALILWRRGMKKFEAIGI